MTVGPSCHSSEPQIVFDQRTCFQVTVPNLCLSTVRTLLKSFFCKIYVTSLTGDISSWIVHWRAQTSQILWTVL